MSARNNKTPRHTKITLDEMSVAEKLKAEAGAAKKRGIASDTAKRESIRKAIPEGFDCAPEEVGRAMQERAERQASRARARARQQGIGG